jgi:pectate lyase
MRGLLRGVALSMVAVAVLSGPATSAFPDRPIEGFGADTVGGEGGAAVVVTSLADDGPGSLRAAVEGTASNRVVTFAVGGTIELEETLRLSGHHVTIDATDAPDPGITITAAHSGVLGALLDIKEAHDIVVRNIRVTDAPDANAGDNIRIWDGSYNIVIDHCSFRRAGDGNVDICISAHDVTVQWSILADCVKNSLIRTGLSNISLHHNLFVNGYERNPQFDDAQNVDMVNNVISGWGSNYGTRTRNGTTGNIVGNIYLEGPGSDGSDAVVIAGDSGPIYMEGNDLPPSCPASGTTGVRFPSAPVTEMDPDDALRAILNEAGAYPRDAEDTDYVADVAETPVEPATWGGIKAMYLPG